MRIIRYYIFKQLIFPFLLSLVTLNFIFMAGYLVKAANFIIGRGVPLSQTLMVLLLALPDMVSYTVPMSLLTAVMIVFGGLAQGNEISAFKACGIHPIHIILPALVGGLMLSFFIFAFNDQVAGDSGFMLRKATKTLALKNPRALIELGRFVRISDNIIFLAKSGEGDNLNEIVAYEVDDKNETVRTIIAESGNIVSRPEEMYVQIVLHNGSISDNADGSVQSVQFDTYEFPPFGQEDIRNMQKKMREYSLSELITKYNKGSVPERDMKKFWTSFYDHLTFPFASFLFALLGVPIAVLVRRGETVISFAISLLAACFYYVLIVGAKTMSIRGVLPPAVAMSLPNLTLLVLGLYLNKRSFRI